MRRAQPPFDAACWVSFWVQLLLQLLFPADVMVQLLFALLPTLDLGQSTWIVGNYSSTSATCI